MTACILLGILYMRFWHVSAAIPFQSSSILSYNSSTPLGGIGCPCKACLRWTQRCSMGLMSGDWEGQTSTWMSLSSNYCEAFLEVCLGSLSCWKTLFSSGTSSFSKLSTTLSSKILQYCCASIAPWTSISFPTPFHPMHLHTIRLFPPPCLTVGVVVQSQRGAPLCFQV